MGTKTISIMDDVYEGLIRKKGKNESFSDEIRRLLEQNKGKLSESAGSWSWMDEKHIKDIESAIKKKRESSLIEKRNKFT